MELKKRDSGYTRAKVTLFVALLSAGFLPVAVHSGGLGMVATSIIAVCMAALASAILWRADLSDAAYRQSRRELLYLRSVIDAIPHFIFARDAKGHFTLVNRAVADFYALSVEEIEGRHLLDVHPDLKQARAWLEEDRVTLERGESWNIAVTDTTQANGAPIWIAAVKKPLPAAIGGVAQVLGVSIDITEQKQAEQALAARIEYEHTAAALFQTFVHCGPHQMAEVMDRVLGRLGRFAGAERAFVYRFDESSGTAALQYSWRGRQVDPAEPLPAAIPMDSLAWLLEWFQLKAPVMCGDIRRDPGIASSFQQAWGSGPAALIAVPIMRDGCVYGFAGVGDTVGRAWAQEELNLLHTVADLFITVWSKHEVQQSLVVARETAEASSRAKSEFLANMSHEIRTPLNSVIGIADLLSEMNPTPRQRQYLEMIRISGAALLSLINDILDLSKIEAGQLKIDPVTTDLHELVDEITSVIAFPAQQAGLELVCRMAPGVPARVQIDPCRLRQVLTNLLNNAVKFTRHGHVYLNIEPIGGSDSMVDLRFDVIDTGIGIPADALERIFEKFTQAEAGTTRRFGGTGLGLAISQQLVALMGGTITAHSVPGDGSSFSFTLTVPVLVPGAERLRPALPANVLVVTRHSLGGEVLLEKLHFLGHEARIVVGGPEALDQAGGWASAQDRPITHILYDSEIETDALPDLRPYLQRLAPKHTPAVVLLAKVTSLVQEEDLISHGFWCALPKPVTTPRLGALLAGERAESLPLPDAAAEPSGAMVDDDLMHGSADSDGPKILLAEDNPFNQRVAVAMLRLIGCQVEVAHNGAEAVDKAQDGTFDLVLMDCQMPTMDGYEATRQIRALPGAASGITIIAMTANAMSGDRTACFEAGMDDFLSKPITKATLSQMIKKWEIVSSGAR